LTLVAKISGDRHAQSRTLDVTPEEAPAAFVGAVEFLLNSRPKRKRRNS